MKFHAFTNCSAVLFLYVTTLTCSPPVFAQERPNVVLVILDACRLDEVDASRGGVPLMPYLSSLPAVRFQNAYAPAPWTAASMISLFSSTHVDTHQEHIGECPFPENMHTMGEYFKSAGFTTLGVQTNGNLAAELGHARGFDQYTYIFDAPADTVTSTGLSLLEGVTDPFFLYVHYIDPHVPYAPPGYYKTLMDYPPSGLSVAEQDVIENEFIPYQTDYLRYHLGLQSELMYAPLSPLGCDATRSLYDAEVRFTDDQLGILITELLAEHPNTIVIITADHGEHFWEHNSLGHVTTVYEPLAHVPFFLMAPGIPEDSVDTVVSTLDMMPTLASLLNLPSHSYWEGRNLFEPRDPGGPVFTCGKTRLPWLRDLEMVRMNDIKLIRQSNTGESELYDLSSDPGELVNLADTQPDTLKQMTTILLTRLLESARANGPDAVISVSPSNYLEVGGTVQLTGPEGTGHVWYKDGLPLNDAQPHISGTTTRTLKIQGLIQDDSGRYECTCNDELLHLDVTRPYYLNVLEENAAPAPGILSVLLVMVILSLLAVRRLHRFNPN